MMKVQTDKEKKMEKFWTMQRRAWVYSVMVALVPLLVAVGTLSEPTAQLVLNVIAAVLAVGGGSMALGNLTPDNVFKLGVRVDDDGA
jgi:thiosulfate reductase cytochrome b subunit